MISENHRITCSIAYALMAASDDQRHLLRRCEQFRPEIGVSNLDQAERTFRRGLAAQLADAVIGRDVVHVHARIGDRPLQGRRKDSFVNE